MQNTQESWQKVEYHKKRKKLRSDTQKILRRYRKIDKLEDIFKTEEVQQFLEDGWKFDCVLCSDDHMKESDETHLYRYFPINNEWNDFALFSKRKPRENLISDTDVQLVESSKFESLEEDNTS